MACCPAAIPPRCRIRSTSPSSRGWGVPGITCVCLGRGETPCPCLFGPTVISLSEGAYLPLFILYILGVPGASVKCESSRCCPRYRWSLPGATRGTLLDLFWISPRSISIQSASPAAFLPAIPSRLPSWPAVYLRQPICAPPPFIRNALSGNCMIAVGMGPGTAAEVSLALKAGALLCLPPRLWTCRSVFRSPGSVHSLGSHK